MCSKIHWLLTLRMPISKYLHHRINKKKYRLGPVLLLVHRYVAAAFAVGLQAAGCFEFFDSIGFLPGEVGVFAAEVAVGCRLFVDGAT